MRTSYDHKLIAVVLAASILASGAPAMAICLNSMPISGYTQKNCPGTETSSGCVSVNWTDSNGQPFGYSCGPEEHTSCLPGTDETAYDAITETRQFMTCDLWGTECGYVYATTSTVIGSFWAKKWTRC